MISGWGRTRQIASERLVAGKQVSFRTWRTVVTAAAWQILPARAGKTVSATCGYPIRQDHPRPGTGSQRPIHDSQDPKGPRPVAHNHTQRPPHIE